MPAEVRACRVCLDTDAKLVDFKPDYLIETYELLSGTQYHPTDGLPSFLCAVCLALLRKCAAFQSQCRNSYQLLNSLVREHSEIVAHISSLDRKLYNLSHPYSIQHNYALTIIHDEVEKEENVIDYIEIDESIVKNEVDFINDDITNDGVNNDDRNDNNFTSDEEPLSEIVKKKLKHSKRNKQDSIIRKKKTRRPSRRALNEEIIKDIKEEVDIDKNNCTGIEDILKESNSTVHIIDSLNEINDSKDETMNGNKSLNDRKTLKAKDSKKSNAKDLMFLYENDIDVIYLTKQQQIEEVDSRKKSNNFVMSQFKCDLCKKGFMTAVTYDNHMAIHDSSRGTHVCDICQSAYSSARNLASHVANSHSRNYVCRRCNCVVKSCHKAKEHIKWHEGVTFNCQLCDATFRKRTTYMTHVRVRHQAGVACAACGDTFSGDYGLNMHVKKSHRGVQVPKSLDTDTTCVHCNMKFKTADALHTHTSIAKGGPCDTTLQHCRVCGQSADSLASLGQHLDTHKAARRYNCTQCDKSYSSGQSCAAHYQRRHAAAHARAQPGVANQAAARAHPTRAYVCEHCGIRCSNKYVLVNHIRGHTGEKPYQCAMCPKRFTLPQRLQIHVRTHTGERPFKCASCPKAFTHKAGLNRHTFVHTGAKPYTCMHCHKSFSQSNSMKIHIRTVHLKEPAPYRRSNKSKEFEYNPNHDVGLPQ